MIAGSHFRHTKETKQKLRGPKTEEHKRKIKEGMKGKQNMLGHTLTEYTRMNISKALLGKKKPLFSESHRKNMSKSRLRRREKLGYINSPDARKKMSKIKINNPNKKFCNTKIEQKIGEELTKRGICYEQNVGLCNIANVDFYLPEYRIVIECDGCYYHNCYIHFPNYHKDTRESDERKTRILTYNGFNVYRFWEHEINESPEKCINKIKLNKK